MTGSKNRILVFCGDRKGLDRIIRQFDHTDAVIVSAMSLRELLSLLEDDSFDALVIADSSVAGIIPRLMPEIRSICPGTEIVVIKENASRKDILESLNCGCSYFMDEKSEKIAEITCGIIRGSRSKLQETPGKTGFRPHPSLSKRETEILYEMLLGKTNREIGKALGIHEKTVKNHLWKIYRKYSIENRTELFGILISECPYFRAVMEYRDRKAQPAFR